MPNRAVSLPTLRPLSPVPTYVGAGVAVLGFVAMLVAWAGVAGENNVARQVPYLISGVGVGLGLVMVGVTIISVAAKRRDATLRERQIELLADALTALGG